MRDEGRKSRVRRRKRTLTMREVRCSVFRALVLDLARSFFAFCAMIAIDLIWQMDCQKGVGDEARTNMVGRLRGAGYHDERGSMAGNDEGYTYSRLRKLILRLSSQAIDDFGVEAGGG